MRHKTDYKPKYSLSIKYVKMIMTKTEFNTLMKKYVSVKLEKKNWKQNIRKNK